MLVKGAPGREVWFSLFMASPCFLSRSSFVISSMSVAYSITDRTPTYLMLFLIIIFLVNPYSVCILAARSQLIFSSFLDSLWKFRFCAWHTVLRLAMLCFVLFAHLGKQHMLFFLSFLSDRLLSWVLPNDQLLYSLLFLLLERLLYALPSLFFGLGCSRILYLHCWPGWFPIVTAFSFDHFSVHRCLISPSSQLVGMASKQWHWVASPGFHLLLLWTPHLAFRMVPGFFFVSAVWSFV